jgi:hypothetical protein
MLRNRRREVQLDGQVLAQMGSSDHFWILVVVCCTYQLFVVDGLGLAVDECTGALFIALLCQLALPSWSA